MIAAMTWASTCVTTSWPRPSSSPSRGCLSWGGRTPAPWWPTPSPPPGRRWRWPAATARAGTRSGPTLRSELLGMKCYIRTNLFFRRGKLSTKWPKSAWMLAMVRVWNFSLLLPARIFLLKFGISIITQTTKVCILDDKGKDNFLPNCNFDPVSKMRNCLKTYCDSLYFV